MRYVYEIMTQSDRLPEDPNLNKSATSLNDRAARVFTAAIDGLERRLHQDIDVVSHAQVLVGDHVVTTLLVRRSGAPFVP